MNIRKFLTDTTTLFYSKVNRLRALDAVKAVYLRKSFLTKPKILCCIFSKTRKENKKTSGISLTATMSDRPFHQLIKLLVILHIGSMKRPLIRSLFASINRKTIVAVFSPIFATWQRVFFAATSSSLLLIDFGLWFEPIKVLTCKFHAGFHQRFLFCFVFSFVFRDTLRATTLLR